MTSDDGAFATQPASRLAPRHATADRVSRRRLGSLVAPLAPLAPLALVASGTACAPPRPAVTETDAGAPDSLPVGGVRPILADYESGRHGFYLVRLPGGYVAYVALCTHEGVQVCVLAYQEDKGLYCPCHGGVWRVADGEALPPEVSGIPHTKPARLLDTLAVRIAGSRVLVTTRRGSERKRAPGEPPRVARYAGGAGKD